MFAAALQNTSANLSLRSETYYRSELNHWRLWKIEVLKKSLAKFVFFLSKTPAGLLCGDLCEPRRGLGGEQFGPRRNSEHFSFGNRERRGVSYAHEVFLASGLPAQQEVSLINTAQ